MGRILSFLETFVPSPGYQPPGLFAIHPLIVDSSSLVPDVVSSARYKVPTRFLESVKFGTLRPFGPEHVAEEVPRKLCDENVLRGVNSQLALYVWETDYLPRIRFVDVSDRSAADYPDLVARDPTDAPTAVLLDLIGPVVVLTNDNDLIDLDLAAPDWIGTVAQGHMMMIMAGQGAGALFLGRAGGVSLLALGQASLNLARKPVALLAVAAIGVGLAWTFPRWWPQVRTHIKDASEASDWLLETVLPVIEELVTQYGQANGGWDRATRGGPPVTLEQRVAQVLAKSSAALNRTEIARCLQLDLSESSRRLLVRDLAGVLGGTRAFVRTDARRWMLGRPGGWEDEDEVVGRDSLLDWTKVRMPTAIARRVPISFRNGKS